MAEDLTYARAGVDINATDAAKRKMADSIDVGDERVLNRMGAFASLVDGRFPGMTHPVLVFKTDEPGSKQKLAFELGRIAGLAHDLVNHLINDVMVMGATPLYMQDCIVCGRIDQDAVADLVAEMSDACRKQGCALVGGETSVQPDVVADGLYVLSASAIGVVEKEDILDGSRIGAGDTVLGVASNGLHTNGYTLVRRLLERNPALRDHEVDGESFIDVIMRPHKCYYRAVRGMFGEPWLKGLAHITGGGLRDNLIRILPPSLKAVLDLPAIEVPSIFKVIRTEGNVGDADMLRTFNMGVGLTAVCSPDGVDGAVRHLSEHGCASYPIGHIEESPREVRLLGEVS